VKPRLRALIIEDEDNDLMLLLRELAKGFDVNHERVETPAAMTAALSAKTWDIVLSDYSLPEFGAPQALAVLKASGLDLPFIVISGTITEEAAVEALKSGAHDFLTKQKLARLLPAIARELREAENRQAQRKADEALRVSEERFRAIMEAVTDAVVSADASGKIIYANDAAEKMFGHDPSALPGVPLTEIMPDPFEEVERVGLVRYLESTQAPRFGRTVEVAARRRDGASFPVELALGTWVAGEQCFLAGVIRDITERKRVEGQLMVADRMVAVGTLAAGVAHEINNPLAAVMANLDLAIADVSELGPSSREPNKLGAVGEVLRDAMEGAERVRNIVRDLRIFSRGEDEKRGPVDLERVIESTLRMARNEIKHRAKVVKNYGEVSVVDAAEARLGQVFLNLIVNAAQAIPEGQADTNEIRISTRQAGDRVEVEIADTGSGIAPDVMKRLFSPFVTTKPPGIGTGLGLSICHRIVTGFGGEITAESQVGKGTAFRVLLLPAKSVVAEAPRPSSVPVRKAGRRGRILVVDDEPMIVKIVKRTLSAEHDVVALDRAPDALGRIEQGERYDVILCDLIMPVMTGMEFYESLGVVAPDQVSKVVFLTGGAFTLRAREFLDKVPNIRLEKPFELSALRSMVNDRVQ
jgi:PAS domain S-box-containing protein